MNQGETETIRQAVASGSPKQGAVKTYSQWQLFFLDRLDRLNRRAVEEDLDEAQALNLKRAIFSTLLDCDAAGVGEDARERLAPRT